jgi:regulator of telomere elongation helicase 1
MSQVEVDIIFMPYNYLMDDDSREGSNLDLANAILIIDEAHNIKSFAEEISNFSISADTLNSVLKELTWIEDSL